MLQKQIFSQHEGKCLFSYNTHHIYTKNSIRSPDRHSLGLKVLSMKKVKVKVNVLDPFLMDRRLKPTPVCESLNGMGWKIYNIIEK